jgi:predicted site-specific integrase-resolvase
MPVTIKGQVYYRTLEVCNMTGISRATLLRWLKDGILKQSTRDTRGWRLFTEEDLKKIRARANRVKIIREDR